MAKVIDFFIMFISILCVVFFIALGLSKNFLLSICIGTMIAVLVTISVRQIKKSSKCDIGQDDYMQAILRGGNIIVITALKSIFSQSTKYTVQSDATDYLIISDEFGTKSLIFACYKLSFLSGEDILRAYKLSVQKECTKLFILAKGVERKTIAVATSLKIKFKLVPYKKVFEIIKTYELLPEKLHQKKLHQKNFGKVFALCFVRKNAKFYFFSALMIALTSLAFTPFKTYYRIVACVGFLFAIISLFDIGQKDNKTKNEIFEHLIADKKMAENMTIVDTEDKNKDLLL